MKLALLALGAGAALVGIAIATSDKEKQTATRVPTGLRGVDIRTRTPGTFPPLENMPAIVRNAKMRMAEGT